MGPRDMATGGRVVDAATRWTRPRQSPGGAGRWGARYHLQKPPELTPEMAARRWRELNLLLHSVALLHSELGGKNPFLPILKLAGTIASAERGLLYLKKESGAGLHMMMSVGFTGRVPDRLRSVNDMAEAAMSSRKPLLVNDPSEEALQNELRLLQDPFCLTVPILLRGTPWGAIQLVRSRPFEEEDAILLWIYALILEGALPGSIVSARLHRSPAVPEAGQGLLDRQHFESQLDREIERSRWAGRPCSLVRLRLLPAHAGDPGRLGSLQVLRAIRRSLRPVDLITSTDGGDLLVFLPDLDGPETQRVTQSLRRNLLQSRALGEAGGHSSLRMAVASYPVDGTMSEELLRAADLFLADPDLFAGI